MVHFVIQPARHGPAPRGVDVVQVDLNARHGLSVRIAKEPRFHTGEKF